MNQFHLYPHQIYRRNTRNNLYTDENRTESIESIEKIRTLTHQKENNISEYEYQKQKRNSTETSQSMNVSKQNLYPRTPSINSQQNNRSKTCITENLDQNQNSRTDLKYDNQIRASQKSSKQTYPSKRFQEDEDYEFNIHKKPKSFNKIGIDQSGGYIDAQLIIDQNQNDKVPNFSRRQTKELNEIPLLNDDDNEFKEEQNPAPQPKNSSLHKKNNRSSSYNRNEIDYRNSQEYQKGLQKYQIRNSQQNSSGNQSFTETGQGIRRKSNPNLIDINFQDIGFDHNSQKKQDRNIPSRQKSILRKSKQIEHQKEHKEEDQRKQYNTNRLLDKYNLEQEYLQGQKGMSNKNINNNSVLHESVFENNSKNEKKINHNNDYPEETSLNNNKTDYRRQYRKNIDAISKQIKTECNSPSNRYSHETLNSGLRSQQNKVMTEPNEDQSNQNLTISKHSLNYNTTLPKFDKDEIEDNQYNDQKTVPIHVILGKIRSRSQYTQKLERLTQSIYGYSPKNTQTNIEEMNNSQINNEYIKSQRQNITSKKYSNMYSKTIDQLQDSSLNNSILKRHTQQNTLDNSISSTSNGLTIRNSQKSKIFGLNKTMDVQKLNEEINLLEEQSQAYQKQLNTSVEIENSNTTNLKRSVEFDEKFKSTLNKQDNQENPRDIAKQLVKIGLAYYSQNQYQLASQKLMKAQQILKRECLQKDILYHWILEHLGNIYQSWGEIEQAFNFYKECYQIRKKQENPNLKQLTQSALNVAQILIQNENYQNATSYLQELLSITAVNMQKNNEWRVKVQLTLAICYGQCQENKQAYNIIYEQLEQIMSKFDLKNNKDILELIIQSVEIIENDYIKKDILSFYQKIQPFINNCFGPTNEISQRVKERMEELSAYF